jgi:hypothetical protein
MKDQSHFGDNELQAAITGWVASQLLVGHVRRVEAWLPRSAFRRYPLQAIRGDHNASNAHDSGSIGIGCVKLAKQSGAPASKSIELQPLHLTDYQYYPAAEYKQVRLQSLSDLRGKTAQTQVTANFTDLVTMYRGSLVTTACLRRWHENGFTSWGELLYFVIQHMTSQQYLPVVLYLLFQGAKPNYVVGSVSMHARAYEWVKRETTVVNVRVFLLLTALSEVLYEEKPTVMLSNPLSPCWQDKVILSERVVLALQRLMLHCFNAKQKKQKLCNRVEFHKLVGLCEGQGSFSLAKVKQSLSLLVMTAVSTPCFRYASDSRLCRQVRVDEHDGALALLQGFSVSPHSVLAYEKELDQYRMQQALAKDRLQFQLNMVSAK